MQTDIAALDRVAPLELGRLAWVVWYGKWIIAACVAGMIWVGGYYGFHMTQPRFAATATLRIDPQPRDLRDVSEHWPAPATDSASLNTEVALLTSDRVLAQVVHQETLLEDPEFNRYLRPASTFSMTALRNTLRQAISGEVSPPPDAADIFDKTVSNLRAALTANHPSETYLFELTALGSSPDKAAHIANAVAAAYVTTQIDDRTATARTDIAWLGSRVAELRQRLQRQEADITALRAAGQVQDTQGLDGLAQSVRAVEQDRAELVAALGALRAEAPLSVRQSATRDRITRDLQDLTAHGQRLTAQLAAQSAGLTALQNALRDADTTRVLYGAFLSRLQEAQVQQGLNAADVRIIAPATAGRYAGPRKMLILQTAALLGLLAGLGIVTMRHMTRRGILHPQMLAQITDSQVIATLDTRTLATRATAGSLMLRTGMVLAHDHRMPQVVLLGTAENGGTPDSLFALIADTAGHADGTVLVVQTPFGQVRGSWVSGVTPVTLSAEDLADTVRLANHFAAWRKDHPLIIIDAGAVHASDPALLLAAHADLCLLAVRFATTPAAKVRAAHAYLRTAAPTPTATVLIHAKTRKLRQFMRCYGPVTAPT